MYNNKEIIAHKMKKEVRALIFSIVSAFLLVGLIIITALKIYEIAVIIFVVFLVFLATSIIEFVGYYKIKNQYFSELEKQLKKMPYVLQYQKRENVKNKTDIKSLYLFPPFSYYVKTHIIDVEYRYQTFKVYDARVTYYDGNAASDVFKGTAYEFSLEKPSAHIVLTTNKRIKPKKLVKISENKNFRLFGTNVDLDLFNKAEAWKNLTVVLKDKKAYVLLEKRRSRFEYGPFKSIYHLNMIDLIQDFEEEFDQALTLLNTFTVLQNDIEK